MSHWSGRARALYGQINWSLDPDSINLFGGQFGYDEYPLLTVIWRANTAWINGTWTELISRADTFIFFSFLLYGVYFLVKMLSHKRWIALSAVFLTCGLPLLYAHAASGYNEIVLQALSIHIIITLIKQEYFITGLLTSAAIFTKNEGLVLFLPFFALLVFWNSLANSGNLKKALQNLLIFFITSLVLLTPWLLFKLVNEVPLSTPTKPEYFYHSGSLRLFLDAMFLSPSSSIYWVMIVLISLINSSRITAKHELRMISALLLAFILAFFFIFSFTGAHVFLENQATIHRSLLQIAPIGIVLITSGYYEIKNKARNR